MPRSGTRVAIVEREEIFRTGLRAILDSLALVVVVGEATTAESAIDLVRSTRPDVLLLDSDVERQSGGSLIHRFRRLSPRTSVVVLSADRAPSHVLAAIRAGAAGYLLKSAPRDQLAAAIDRAVAGEAFVDPALAGRVVQALSERDGHAVLDWRPAPLTPREGEILGEISRGRSNKEIAADLQIASGTVKIHIERILRKLSAANRVEAATLGLHYGLIPSDDAQPGVH